MRDFDAASGKYVSRIEWREVAQFDGGEVIFKDGVAGDEMCPHFRQVSECVYFVFAYMRMCAVTHEFWQESKCQDCADGVPPTSYADY